MPAPASYLIPPAQWPAHRDEVLARTGRPAGFAQRLTEIDEEIAGYLDLLEPMLASGDGSLRRDPDGTLHLKPLAAEVIDATAQAEVDDIYAMLPTVPLTEILIEADRETNFTRHFTHAGGARPRVGEIEHRRNLYAAVLAQACNFGATRIAELTGIPADTIEWTTRWYLSEANLRLAHSDMIDAHFRSWLAQSWGGGTLSSSDGLRLPMRGKSLTARALSRYFLGEGLTSYTHVSDQHTTFGTQIIVSTDRDAPYVLDEILGNTTELPCWSTRPTRTGRPSSPSPCSTSSASGSPHGSPSSPSSGTGAPTPPCTTSAGPTPGRSSPTPSKPG